MELFLINNDFRYAVEQILSVMFPEEKPVYPPSPTGQSSAVITLSKREKFAVSGCLLTIGGRAFRGQARVALNKFSGDLEEKRLLQRIVKLSFYRASVKYLGTAPSWGALTGIRPGKIASAYREAGLSGEAIIRKMRDEYDVSPQKAKICLETSEAALDIARSLSPRDICLYIGIPFCPSRCSYCSFVSLSAEKSLRLIPEFLDSLAGEISAAAEVVRECGLRIISIYIGGGTPTTLDAGQLDSLLSLIAEKFDLSALREFSVEAGRPETITGDKLRALSSHAVNRISINPQSMNDSILENIGRRHSVRDIYTAYNLTRAAGNFQINMDLIAGLPGDSPESFLDSLREVLALNPENITVHTLAVKRGSTLSAEKIPLPPEQDVTRMLEHAQENLYKKGYFPFYLYRQKYTAGGLENIGWSKKRLESTYNVCIMEELCSIISLGGAASTKLVTGTGRIERMFNPKYPLEYIDRIEKIIENKGKIREFYNALQP